MSRRGPAWRLGCALLLTLSLALLPGCSDPEASAYTEVTVGKLTVDRPADWATELAVEAPWTQGFRLAPDSVEQQQVSGDFGEYPTAAAAMGTLIGQAQVGLKGFEIVESRDVEIKGATTGRVTRYTITDNTGSQLSGEWFVAAHWPYPAVGRGLGAAAAVRRRPRATHPGVDGAQARPAVTRTSSRSSPASHPDSQARVWALGPMSGDLSPLLSPGHDDRTDQTC